MHVVLFDQSIVKILNEYFSNSNEYVESILLASYGFEIQFVNFNIHCREKVFASINGVEYEWDEAPNSGPWGSLGRQRAAKALLKKPNLLSIMFDNGDFIDIQTVEGQYESVIFKFPPVDESFVMEIY